MERKVNTLKRMMIQGFVVLISGMTVLGCSSGDNQSTSTPSGPAPLALTSSSSSVVPGGSIQFTASGGTAPYQYFLGSGGGHVDISSGIYVASLSAGSAQVGVRDAVGTQVFASITISSNSSSGAFSVSYTPNPASVGQVITVIPQGGVPPYYYSLVSGQSSLVGNTYTANQAETVQIQVSDSTSATAVVSIVVSGYVSPANDCSQLTPVYRFSTQGDHLMTISQAEGANNANYQYDGVSFYLCGTATGDYQKPLRRCIDGSGKHFLSIETNCEGQNSEGILGYLSPVNGTGRTSIYRYRYPSNGDRISSSQTSMGGWILEGLQGYVP